MLKFDPILIVNITYRYFKVKNSEMAYLSFHRRRRYRGGGGVGLSIFNVEV